MSKELLKTSIKREKGKLYFCGTDKKTGNVTINEAIMGRGKKKAKVAKKKK